MRKYILNKFVLSFPLNDNCYLLLNTLNGAADVITGDVKRKLELIIYGQQNAVDKKLIKYLKERGYIYSSNSALKKDFLKVYRMHLSRLNDIPFTFVIIPTYLCNLACVYCYESSYIKSLPQILSPYFVEKAFEAMLTIVKNPIKSKVQMALFGGEPLLYDANVQEAITEIFKRASMLNWKIYIFTNGTTLLKYLPILEKYKWLVDGVQVTIDGPQDIRDKRRVYRDGRGTFNDIVNGLNECLKIGVQITVRTNVDNYNLPHLHELIKYFQSRGWLELPNFRHYLGITQSYGRYLEQRYCRLTNVSEMMREIFILKSEDKLLKNTPIGATYLSIIRNLLDGKVNFPKFFFCSSNVGRTYVFDPYGDMYNCMFAIGQKDLVIGKYAPQLVLNKKYLKIWEKDITKLDECVNCKFALICGGGCTYQKIRGLITPGNQCQVKEEIVVGLREAINFCEDDLMRKIAK